MTWFASHIYAEPTEAIIEILKLHPVLSKGIYWIKNFEGYEWLPGIRPHELPPNGLLVVREVCDPTLGKDQYDTQVEAQWHLHVNRRHKVLSWNTVICTEDLPVIMPDVLPISGYGSDRLIVDDSYKFPSIEFLRYLKMLSSITDTTVCYYHHMSGAEMTVHREFAWIFGKNECVFVRHGGTSVMRYTNTEKQELSTRNTVLMLMLQYYGLNLSTSYFAPHTRHFNWAKHAVNPN
jgi:hypothetical protein